MVLLSEFSFMSFSLYKSSSIYLIEEFSKISILFIGFIEQLSLIFEKL